MAPGWHTQDPAQSDTIPLAKDAKRAKQLLRRHYAGQRLASPMGGFLEPLRVRSEDDGSGTALFECSTSSLRFALPIPKATRTERQKVKGQQDAGEDPTCPRHDDPPRRLQRVGSHLVCPACGVRYGRPA
jgi:hypothetical protein